MRRLQTMPEMLLICEIILEPGTPGILEAICPPIEIARSDPDDTPDSASTAMLLRCCAKYALYISTAYAHVGYPDNVIFSEKFFPAIPL